MSIEWLLVYIFLGSAVGFMAGLLGIGGGGILVPVLVSVFGYQGLAQGDALYLALGTSLACMIITSSASLRAHALRGNVGWRLALGLAPGMMLGAFLISHYAIKFNPLFIAAFFSAFMALIAAQMLFNWQPKHRSHGFNPMHLIWIGIGIGALSALATVGTGFLVLSFLNYRNIELKKAIGTSAALGLPIALAGTLGYITVAGAHSQNEPFIIGFVHVPAFLAIAFTSIFGAPLGVKCASTLPAKKLKRIFAAVSLGLSIKMLCSSFAS